MLAEGECAIKPKDFVITDDAKYHKGFISFSKSRRQELTQRPLMISKEWFGAFQKLLSAGTCKIDTIRFNLVLRKTVVSQSDRLVDDIELFGLECIDYPGGRAYLFD